MFESPFQIYENEKGWNVLECTSRGSNKVILQRLSKGVANHYARLLTQTYEKGHQKAVADRPKAAKRLEGWLGGHYSDLALHTTKEGSGRGIFGETLDDALMEFQETKIRITVEILEQ